VNTYSWPGAPAVPGTKSITATNNATGVSGGTSFTPTADDTAPSAGSVTPPNTTQVSTSVSVAFATGTDGGSGLGTRLLQRQSATLTVTTCGSYGGWTTAATNPASSPFSDTVTAGFCYTYQYVVADNVGNTNTATSTNVVSVTAGTSYFNGVSGESGLLSYWRLGEGSGASPMADAKAINNGTYVNTPAVGVAGAMAGDSNTAVQFNGTNQYGTATRQISGDFSISPATSRSSSSSSPPRTTPPTGRRRPAPTGGKGLASSTPTSVAQPTTSASRCVRARSSPGSATRT